MKLENLTGKEQSFYESFIRHSYDENRWKQVQTNMRRAFSFNDAKIYFRMFVTNDWSRTQFRPLNGAPIPFAELDWDLLTREALKSNRKRHKPYPVRMGLFNQRRRNYTGFSKYKWTDYWFVIASDNLSQYRVLASPMEREGYVRINQDDFYVEDREQFLLNSHEFCETFVRNVEPPEGEYPEATLYYHLEIGNKMVTSSRKRIMYVNERLGF